MSDLKSYIPMIKFLAKFYGSNTEFILYDTDKKEICHVENSFAESHKVGNKITGVELRFIEDEIYKTKDYLVNYRSFTQDRKKLRSATYFVKDNKNNLKGMLIINFQVKELIEMREFINEMINGPERTEEAKEEHKFFETFDFSFEDLMSSVIQEAVNKYNVPPDRLSMDEKSEIIKALDKKGTFLIKGSVAETARILNCSEVTVYRYIRES